MSARLAAIVLIVLALPACGGDRQPVATPTTPTVPPPVTTIPPTSPPVQGTVVDFQTTRPIAGATVSFSSGTTVTDSNGRYSLPSSSMNSADTFMVNNVFAGRGFPRGTNNRAGDLAVHEGPCVTRYGMVVDGGTFLPVVGATILDLSNRVIATTDRNGWYQVDKGCSGPVGFNTTWLIATHPDYNQAQFASGRGFSGLFREDVKLTRR